MDDVERGLTTEQRARLIELVAEPKIRRGFLPIRANNEKAGDVVYWNAQRAAESNLCLAIYTKDVWVVIDFDDLAKLEPEKLQKLPKGIEHDGALRADAYAQALDVADFQTMVWNSGGGRSAHVYALCDSQRRRQEAQALAKQYHGDDKTNARIRPPGSRHRTGTYSTLRSGFAGVESLLTAFWQAEQVASAEMSAEKAKTALLIRVATKYTNEKNRPAENGYNPAIDKKLTELLSTRSETRHKLAFLIVAYMKGRGCSVSQIVEALVAYPEGAGHKYYDWNNDGRRVSEGKARQRAEQDVERAYKKIVSNQTQGSRRSQVQQRLDEIQANAIEAGTSWPGRRSAHNLLMALIEDCRKQFEGKGTLAFSKSQRGLALLGNTTQPTAGKDLAYLLSSGWILATNTAEMGDAKRFFLNPNKETERPISLSLSPQEGNESGGLAHVQVIKFSDVFKSAVVAGKRVRASIAVYLDELPNEFTTAQLAARMNRKRKDVWAQLAALEANGLLKHLPRSQSWTKNLSHESLRDADRCLGKENFYEDKARRYKLESEGYRAFKARAAAIKQRYAEMKAARLERVAAKKKLDDELAAKREPAIPNVVRAFNDGIERLAGYLKASYRHTQQLAAAAG